MADSLSKVVKSGDSRRSLEVIRDYLAEALETAKYAKDKPPLAKQLVDVMKAIDELPVPGEVSEVDELTKARADRRSKAAGS